MLTYFFFNLFMKENKRKGMEALGSKKKKDPRVSSSIAMEMTFNIEAFGSNLSWH